MVLLKCIAAVFLVLTVIYHGCLGVWTAEDEAEAKAKVQGRISEDGSLSSFSSSPPSVSFSSSPGGISGDGSPSRGSLASQPRSSSWPSQGSQPKTSLLARNKGLAEPTFAGSRQNNNAVPPGCSCSDHELHGYGQCKKGRPSYLGGSKFCFLNLPSTCNDIQESPYEPGVFGSAEACKIKSGSFKISKLMDVDSEIERRPTQSSSQTRPSVGGCSSCYLFLGSNSKLAEPEPTSSGSFKISKLMDVDSEIERRPTQSASQTRPSERGCRSCYLKDRKSEGNLGSYSDLPITGLQQGSDVIPEDTKMSGSFKVSKLMDVDSKREPTMLGSQARTRGCRSCHF